MITRLAFIAILGVAMLKSQAFAQEVLDRTKRPVPKVLPNVELPLIQKATLANGLNVWLVEKHQLPLVAFNLVINAGSDHDPPSGPGVASMTAELLDEGTETRTALQIAEQLDFLGASFSIRSALDGTFISLNTLTKHLDEALRVYADVLAHPTFPQAEFDRLKNQRLASLLQQKDQPATIASISFNRIIYGADHSYGNNAAGTEKSIKDLRRENLVEFYNRYYRPNNATLIVVGDTELKDITAKFEHAVQDWKPGATAPPQLPPTPVVERRRVYMIDKPGAVQSEIRIGYPALARNTPDFFAVTLMNRILGGQFSSRLNLNLREKHGFSYGVRSAFSFTKHPGPFVASGAVVTAKTDSALREFLYEIDLMHNQSATNEELDFVKKGLTGNFALGFETPSQIAAALTSVALYGLPENYLQTYIENIHHVSREQVETASKKYLDTSKMAIVFVGDLKAVRENVEKLKLGDTVICDLEGNTLPQ